MNIDIKKAICTPFKGNNWQIKLIIGMLIVFYYFFCVMNINLTQYRYLFFISSLFVTILYLAYISTYIHNQLQEDKNDLPAWSINKLFFWKAGLKAFFVYISFDILCIIPFFPFVFVPILPFATISFSENFKIKDAFKFVKLYKYCLAVLFEYILVGIIFFTYIFVIVPLIYPLSLFKLGYTPFWVIYTLFFSFLYFVITLIFSNIYVDLYKVADVLNS